MKKRNRFKLFTLLFPTSTWMLLFILIPIAMFAVYSFWIVKNENIVREFSFGNYINFFTNPMYFSLLFRSLIIAFGVTILTFIMSYPLGLFIFRQKGRVKSLIYMFILIPLFTSYIVRVYAMRLVLGSNGLINNFLMFIGLIEEPLQALLFNRFAIFLTLCVTLSPFMVMPIFTSLEKVPRSLIEASHDLGASKIQTFWRVIFPISVPGVLAGSMFIFILSLGDFLTPILVGGTQGMTFSKTIQLNFGMAYNWPLGAALSIILLLIALSTIAVSNRFGALREI